MLYKLKENRVFRSYLGGKHIDMFCGQIPGEDGNFPEDWTASAIQAFNPGRETITEGLGQTEDGQYIKDLPGSPPQCLVKLLDAAERLVIQVHPTVEFAQKHYHSKVGKTECWYFLGCEKDACVYLGFREGITQEKWTQAFEQQDVMGMLNMLHKIPVKTGDCIFVDGGVPHAIGAGCFMIEVQEPSDLMGITERITPSGRLLCEEKLHGGIGIEAMLNMFDYTGRNLNETLAMCHIKGNTLAPGVYELVGRNRTDKFSIYRLENEAICRPERDNGVIIVTRGAGVLNGLTIATGDRLFYTEESEIVLKGRELQAVICC